jgi:probable F420-dependent oxidoreductase
MLFGLHLPNAGLVPEGPGLVRIAQTAERLGYHSVWLFDHLFTPVSLDSKYPYSADGSYVMAPELPFADPVAVMGAIAGGTSTIRFGTRVLIATYRHPVVLAKELATIDWIAGGRMLLGVGAGWMAEEFDAVGVPVEERFARMDEHIALMRNAWQQGVTSYDGQFYSHPAAGFGPQPPQPGGTIPIIVGGHGDAALRRAATYGDGWAVSASGAALKENGAAALAERIGRLRELCAEVGRDFDELMLVGQCSLKDGPERIEGYAALGIDVLDVMAFGTEQQVIEQAETFWATVGSAAS